MACRAIFCAICFFLIGCGGGGGGGGDTPGMTPPGMTPSGMTPPGVRPGPPPLSPVRETYRSGTFNNGLIGTNQNDVFTIAGDITGFAPDLDINDLVEGNAGNDELRLESGAVVNFIDFNNFAPGDLSLRNVETITIDGGTVNTIISANLATAAVTINLRSGSIGSNTTIAALIGSPQSSIFNISGSTINGGVSGNDRNDTFNISGGIINIESGLLAVAGREGNDTFNISGNASINGSVSGNEGNDIFNISGGIIRESADVAIPAFAR